MLALYHPCLRLTYQQSRASATGLSTFVLSSLTDMILRHTCWRNVPICCRTAPNWSYPNKKPIYWEFLIASAYLRCSCWDEVKRQATTGAVFQCHGNHSSGNKLNFKSLAQEFIKTYFLPRVYFLWTFCTLHGDKVVWLGCASVYFFHWECLDGYWLGLYWPPYRQSLLTPPSCYKVWFF